MARFPVFQIAETTQGVFALTSSDFGPYMEPFESNELDGGGYDWERIAIYLLEKSEPSLVSEITFDSEASLFCALAENHTILTRLMDLMRSTLRSKKRLSVAIAESKSVDEDPSDADLFPFVVMVYFEGYVPEVQTKYEAVSQAEASCQRAESACCSGGESVVFVRTQNVDETCKCCLSALRDNKLLSFALIGIKAMHDDAYSVLWPKNDERILKPIFDP